jgi:hypothetical protein
MAKGGLAHVEAGRAINLIFEVFIDFIRLAILIPPCSSPYGGLWGTLALSPTPPVASGR